MSDKKFTPQEAAILVLKKAEELYKSSSLAKGDWAKIHSKLKREGYSEESADKIDGAIKAKMNKSDAEGHNPDAKADAQLGEQVEQDVKQHEEQNADPAHAEPQMRGHIKLAKFMGRMEHKKSLQKGETGHEKGVHTAMAGEGGMSSAGNAARPFVGDKSGTSNKEHAQDKHSEVLGQMKAQPKPKLPG